MHTCFFVYDPDASRGSRHVSICRGCGTVSVTNLREPKYPLFETETPGFLTRDRRRIGPGLID